MPIMLKVQSQDRLHRAHLILFIDNSTYGEYADSGCQNEVHNGDNNNPHHASQSDES